MCPSSGEVEIKIKLKDTLSEGLKKVNGEFGKSMTGMSKAAQKESKRMRKAFAVLDFRPFKDVDRDIKRAQTAFDRLKKSGKLSAGRYTRPSCSSRKRPPN